MTKPFSAACERNREPILAVLRRVLPSSGRVLEIGSGTGQHAVYFGAGRYGLVVIPALALLLAEALDPAFDR